MCIVLGKIDPLQFVVFGKATRSSSHIIVEYFEAKA